MKDLFEVVREKIPSLKLIRVFGEFYGGLYPNKKSSNKPIQTSIVYCPELEFEAFDLFYETTEGTSAILNYKQACELFEKVKLPFAEIQAEGKLQDLMS